MEIGVRLGVVLIVVFFATELVVNPLFELVKNKLISARLRKLLNRGTTVQLGPENQFLNKFGLSTGVRTNDRFVFFFKCAKIIVKLYVILIIALWENDLSEGIITRSETSRMTLSAWNQTDGSVSFVSVTPHIPLAESELSGLPVFNVSEKHNEGKYTKRRNTELELRYFSDCVEDVNGIRTVYYALLRKNGIQTETVCLNGAEGRDRITLMSFNPNNDENQTTEVDSMEVERELATDGLSTLYAVKVRTKNNFLGKTEFNGCATLAKLAHFSNNVGWSFYGFAEGPDGDVLRLNIVVSSFPGGGSPCPRNICNGNWSFSRSKNTLPSGDAVDGFIKDDYSNQLESINLRFHDAPIGKGQESSLRRSVAMAWLSETSYATFKADEGFVGDLMGRLTGNVFFFSDLGHTTRSFRAFDRRRVTLISGRYTILLLSAILFLIVFSIIGTLVEKQSQKTFNMTNDILSRDTLLELYKRPDGGEGSTYRSLERKISVGVVFSGGVSRLRVVDERNRNSSTLQDIFPDDD